MRTARAFIGGAVGRVAAGVAAILLVAGCSGVLDGQPAAEGEGGSTSRPETVEWNPCEQLPAEALSAMKVDPGSKEKVTDAPQGVTSWRMCGWDSTQGPYGVGVGSGIYSVEDWRTNSTVTGFREVQVNDRRGLTFYSSSDPDHLDCSVSIPGAQASLLIDVGWDYSARESIAEAPPCTLALEHARAVEPFLPD